MVDVRGLDPRFAPSIRLSSVRFLTYTGKEIEGISCKRISNPNTFDSLLHPNLGGLYDPALGPCDKQDLCGTCGLNYVHCPGHMGHIPLPLPVYHPVLFTNLYSLLRISCWNCHRLKCTPIRAHLLASQLELIDLGLVSDTGAMMSELGVEADNEKHDEADDKREVKRSSKGAKKVKDSGVTESVESITKMEEKSGSEIIRSINKYVEKCKQNALDAGPSLRIKPKNLVESRTSLIMEFVKMCGRVTKECSYCLAPLRSLRQENHTKIFLRPLTKTKAKKWRVVLKANINKKRREVQNEDEVDKEEDSCPSVDTLTKQSYLTPLEVREHVISLWENQRAVMNAIIGCSVIAEAERGGGNSGREISAADVFFLDVVSVPASRFRPVSCTIAGSRAFAGRGKMTFLSTCPLFSHI